MDFQDYETLQPFFAYEAMFKDVSAAPTPDAAPVAAAFSNTVSSDVLNIQSPPPEDPNVIIPPLEGNPNQ